MKRRTIDGVLFLVLALVLTYAPSWAQTYYGSIVGTVSDSTGAIVVGAEVRLSNLGTGETRTVVTGDAGLYRFVTLLPGQYQVDVQLDGFKRTRRGPVVVEVQSTVQIDIALELGNVTETVEVTAETPLLQSETASLGEVVSGREVVELPLNGRNVFNLAALAPGVVPQGGAEGTPAAKNIFTWGNYQIGGGQANQNAMTVDGVPVNIAYANVAALVPTQDSIQEFAVQTNNLGAEFGRFSGGVINLSTRGGSNEFHGAAYEFMRNTVLNANPFFNNARNVERPPFVQNQFGGNLGGPILRDKLFFFGSYEGFRLREGRSYVGSVPTAAMRSADFSAFQQQAHDPFSISSSEQQRAPFANNHIPANMISPVATNMLDFYPAPNRGGLVNNYATNYSSGGDQNQTTIRSDFTATDKHRLFAKWTRWDMKNLGQDPYGTGAALDQGPEDNTTNQIVIADTYVISPAVVFDLRLGWLRFRYDRSPLTRGTPPSSVGLPASLDSQVALFHKPYPVVQDYGFGSGTGSIITARDNNYTITPSLTWIHGSHTLKFGGDIRRMDHNYGQSNNASGRFDFNRDFTASNPVNPTGGIGFASFLLGTGSGGGISSPSLVAAQKIYSGGYVNDTWRVGQRLTLQLGFRWEREGPFTERYDRATVLLPDAEHPYAPEVGLPLRGRVAFVNTPLRTSRANMDARNLFSPRLGLAYRVTDSLVVRAGLGVFYLPSDAIFTLNPDADQINRLDTPWVTTIDNGVTPFHLLGDPFPDGVLQPGQRDEQLLLGLTGLNVTAPQTMSNYPYMQQWNLNIQKQFGNSLLVDAAYAGSKGTHLATLAQELNQLPDQYLQMGPALLQTVPNPFYGVIQTGSLANQTTTRGQLLRPYPHFTSFRAAGEPNRDSTYHAFQFKLRKRFGEGGNLLVSYTASKTIANTTSFAGWLESNSNGSNGSNNDLSTFRNLSNYDVAKRLVVSYVLDLPFGKGRALGRNAGGITGVLISGWGINGVTTLQSGFPVRVQPNSNLSNSFGGSQRADNNGQSAKKTGRAQDRLDSWYDTSVFSQPAPFTFGNASSILPDVRGHGIANFDFAIFKNTRITEKIGLQFRAEFFNTFNRTQFGHPGNRLGSPNFGVVTNQINEPRLTQLALRLQF